MPRYSVRVPFRRDAEGKPGDFRPTAIVGGSPMLDAGESNARTLGAWFGEEIVARPELVRAGAEPGADEVRFYPNGREGPRIGQRVEPMTGDDLDRHPVFAEVFSHFGRRIGEVRPDDVGERELLNLVREQWRGWTTPAVEGLSSDPRLAYWFKYVDPESGTWRALWCWGYLPDPMTLGLPPMLCDNPACASLFLHRGLTSRESPRCPHCSRGRARLASPSPVTPPPVETWAGRSRRFGPWIAAALLLGLGLGLWWMLLPRTVGPKIEAGGLGPSNNPPAAVVGKPLPSRGNDENPARTPVVEPSTLARTEEKRDPSRAVIADPPPTVRDGVAGRDPRAEPTGGRADREPDPPLVATNPPDGPIATDSRPTTRPKSTPTEGRPGGNLVEPDRPVAGKAESTGPDGPAPVAQDRPGSMARRPGGAPPKGSTAIENSIRPDLDKFPSKPPGPGVPPGTTAKADNPLDPPAGKSAPDRPASREQTRGGTTPAASGPAPIPSDPGGPGDPPAPRPADDRKRQAGPVGGSRAGPAPGPAGTADRPVGSAGRPEPNPLDDLAVTPVAARRQKGGKYLISFRIEGNSPQDAEYRLIDPKQPGLDRPWSRPKRAADGSIRADLDSPAFDRSGGDEGYSFSIEMRAPAKAAASRLVEAELDETIKVKMKRPGPPAAGPR